MATHECRLSRLGLAQLEAVAALERSGQTHPWSDVQLADALRDERVSIWGAFEGEGRLRGYAVLSRLPFEAELQAIAVAPAARRRGIALALLQRLIEEARQWGSERLLLEVRAGNAAALGLYRQLGFETDGRRRGYYPTTDKGTREDAVLLSLPLL